ncbi:MAG TPA: hypothetical protein DIT64_19810 [Verrucomicrobiales bacterium]|nr:hypothetical protein [Verrucomicrobiales bacterium]
MEFNFSLSRILLFAALAASFAVFIGFTPPAVPADSMLDPRRVSKAWSYCALLYLGGAVSASLIDHYVGTLDRSNLRLLYMLLGAALMIGSSLWLRGLSQAV